jgi:hypothetical protein
MATDTQKHKPPCRSWEILLGEYALGTIRERDRARLEEHLGRCARCRRALAETEEVYRLLADFELAKPGPFFAAKVDRAMKSAAGEEAAEGRRARVRAGLWGRLRAPAFVSAAAAAAAAIVAAVLYVKVWLPDAAEVPAAPTTKGMPPAASVAKADRSVRFEEKEVAEAEARLEELRAPAPAESGEAAAVPPAPAEALASDADALEGRTETREPLIAAGAPPAGGRRDGRRSYAAAAEDKTRKRETRAPAADMLGPGGAGAGGVAFGAVGRGYGRGEVEKAALARTGVATLTAADVEAWMDARFEADVERLTSDDDALLDYVTPNGSLMAYFYELPLEEQRALLSRLRREAEETSAAEMLLSP